MSTWIRLQLSGNCFYLTGGLAGCQQVLHTRDESCPASDLSTSTGHRASSGVAATGALGSLRAGPAETRQCSPAPYVSLKCGPQTSGDFRSMWKTSTSTIYSQSRINDSMKDTCSRPYATRHNKTTASTHLYGVCKQARRA